MDKQFGLFGWLLTLGTILGENAGRHVFGTSREEYWQTKPHFAEILGGFPGQISISSLHNVPEFIGSACQLAGQLFPELFDHFLLSMGQALRRRAFVYKQVVRWFFSWFHSSGWWMCGVDAKVGWAPPSYLKKCENESDESDEEFGVPYSGKVE